MTAEPNLLYAAIVGLAGWCVPGAGHFMVGERTRGTIIFLSVTLLFVMGLYIGSIGVIDSFNARPWYIGQIMTSPVVALFAKMNPSIGGVATYPSYGKPFEIGQIYTTIAGLLNVLCIVSAVYTAYTGKQQPPQGAE